MKIATFTNRLYLYRFLRAANKRNIIIEAWKAIKEHYKFGNLGRTIKVLYLIHDKVWLIFSKNNARNST